MIHQNQASLQLKKNLKNVSLKLRPKLKFSATSSRMESALEQLFFKFENETTESMLQFLENISKRRQKYFVDKQLLLNSRLEQIKSLSNRQHGGNPSRSNREEENSKFSAWTEDSNLTSSGPSNSPQTPPCRKTKTKQSASTPKKLFDRSGGNPEFHLGENSEQPSPILKKHERCSGQCPYCQKIFQINMEPIEFTLVSGTQSNSTLYEAHLSTQINTSGSESQFSTNNEHNWGNERCRQNAYNNMSQQSHTPSHPTGSSRGYFGPPYNFPQNSQNCCQPNVYHTFAVKEKLEYQQTKPDMFGPLTSEKKFCFGGTGDTNESNIHLKTNNNPTFKDILKMYKEAEGSRGSNNTSQFSTHNSSVNSIISPSPSEHECEVETEPSEPTRPQLTLEELDELLKSYSRY